MNRDSKVVRLAAVGDLHYTEAARGTLQTLAATMAEQADVLLLCGDVVDYGRPEEARLFARELTARAQRPILAVLGNHEFEAGQADEVRHIFTGHGIRVLDGDALEIAGIGFAGAKGFAGGFGEYALQPWGEASLKRFVHEAVDEALKLESALAKLRTPVRIALLHYSPIRGTVLGEPAEIIPFLGSSRLEEPLNRYSVTAAFHGHAHGGQPEGRTHAAIPVYNVALPVLKRCFPGRPPFRLVEIPVGEPAPETTPTAELPP
jgi:Icc-related predicted phosphoesterase